MKFKCSINMDNEAFQTPYPEELLKKLEDIKEIVQTYGYLKREHTIFDSNGNTVGSFKITGKR